MGSRDTMAHVHTLLEAFCNMSPSSACLCDQAIFQQQAKPLVLGLHSSSTQL